MMTTDAIARTELPWNIRHADVYLLRTAADHIEDGEFMQEAWEIIEQVQSGDTTETGFRNVLRSALEWDEDMIDRAVAEVRRNAEEYQ